MDTSEREKLSIRFSNVFARLQYKINFDINNTSSFLLATDLLRDSSKRRLFKIVAKQVEEVFLELLNDGHSLNSIQARSIFFSIIRQSTQEFLSGCYGYEVNIQPQVIKNSFYTKLILSDETILLRVPLQILQIENSNLNILDSIETQIKFTKNNWIWKFKSCRAAAMIST